jgi:hypothetical protein
MLQVGKTVILNRCNNLNTRLRFCPNLWELNFINVNKKLDVSAIEGTTSFLSDLK